MFVPDKGVELWLYSCVIGYNLLPRQHTRMLLIPLYYSDVALVTDYIIGILLPGEWSCTLVVANYDQYIISVDREAKVAHFFNSSVQKCIQINHLQK